MCSLLQDVPDLAAFAPAIGTAHEFYKGSPQIAYELLDKITETMNIPIAPHGGTGLSNEQFHRCISHGCVKVNISTMHKQQFINGFLGIAETKERATEPIPYIAE
tara:strand:+ start:1232 stop:1546 length:315 start_codon:yes stop_codon:yes gene_type:complete